MLPWSSGTLSLFLASDDGAPVDSELPLTIAGSLGSGFFRGVPLFLACGDDGNIQSGTLPLFLAGPTSDRTCRNVNLFIEGAYHCRTAAAPLFLCNTNEGAAAPLSLFIQGSGEADGALPWNGSLNLFLRRWPAAAMPLFLQSPGTPGASGVDLFMGGCGLSSGQVSLSIPHVVGACSSGVPLYMCGW